MKVIGYHVTHRLTQDIPLVTSDADRRALARSVLTIARPFQLLAFRWADTHGHSEVIGERDEVSEFARRAEIGMQRKLAPGIPFQPAHLKPIHDLHHLENTFWYIVTQDEHHGIGNDPFHEASNVPDLLRMRGVGASTCATVAEFLARVHRSDILETIALDDPDGADFVDGDIADAAAAAMGLASLTGHSKRVRMARTATVHLCRDHLTTREIAARLCVDRTTVQRMSALEPNRALVRAVQQQLTMRTRHRTSLELAPPPDALSSDTTAVVSPGVATGVRHSPGR
jgi:hypothetical protein